MRIVLSITKWVSGLFLLALAAVFLWLWLAPPELIRVGANYAAKIVCSNVFLAERKAEEVLALDVQAPGHPLLRIMRVDVDADESAVRAGLFGLFGQGLAVFRGATGCAVAPDGDIVAARGVAPHRPPDVGSPSLWPLGNRVEPSPGAAVAAALDDPAVTGPGMRAVVIVRDGRIIAERYAPGFVHDTPLLGWSMTKTVNAAITGTVVGAGLLSVEARRLFPRWAGDDRADITVAHLLGMESGLAFNEHYGGVTDVTRMLYLEPDMATFAAGKPLLQPAGTDFSYSSGSSVMLARVWQNAIGEEADALAWPYRALFAPIGMHSAVLETDARGTFVGSSYMYATARDWARFGQLLLQEGRWLGRQILPEGWVEWMRTPTEVSGGEYGRGLWLHGPRVTTPRHLHQDDGFDLPADAFWLIGHDGQTMTIIPSHRLVILRMGLTPTLLAYKPQALVEAVVKALEEKDG